MPSEEVAKKHLNVDIKDEQFWMELRVDKSKKQMEKFEKPNQTNLTL